MALLLGFVADVDIAGQFAEIGVMLLMNVTRRNSARRRAGMGLSQASSPSRKRTKNQLDTIPTGWYCFRTDQTVWSAR